MSQQESRVERVPSAFISYSWDSPEHRKWVIELATKLRRQGVEVILDEWHLHPGSDKTVFMEKSVQSSDYVLLICTPNYKQKADGRIGGVGWEASIVTGELAKDLMQTKFIPILREGTFESTLPVWSTNRVGINLSGNPYSGTEFDRLLKNLHGEITAPPVGPRPQFGKNKPHSIKVATESKVRCTFSPRALLISSELALRAFPIIEEIGWSDKIEFTVAAETNDVDSFFSRLRGHKESLVVAYGFDVAIARLTSLSRLSSMGKALWKIQFQPISTDFCNDNEMGTSSTTADEFAEKRVRRLLLNENPMAYKSDNSDQIGLLNEAMRESLLQGLNSRVKIERSCFIDLYATFGADSQAFIDIAWISAVTDLKLSASVEQIDNLALELEGNLLAVDFSGHRHRKYVNTPPFEIKVHGQLQIPADSALSDF